MKFRQQSEEREAPQHSVRRNTSRKKNPPLKGNDEVVSKQ